MEHPHPEVGFPAATEAHKHENKNHDLCFARIGRGLKVAPRWPRRLDTSAHAPRVLKVRLHTSAPHVTRKQDLGYNFISTIYAYFTKECVKQRGPLYLRRVGAFSMRDGVTPTNSSL